jgi:hypothetical protein
MLHVMFNIIHLANIEPNFEACIEVGSYTCTNLDSLIIDLTGHAKFMMHMGSSSSCPSDLIDKVAQLAGFMTRMDIGTHPAILV